MKKTKAIVGILAITSIFTIAAVAFAHGGYGRQGGYGGHMMDDGRGYGHHMRGYGGGQDLSEEEAAKLNAARDKFFGETRELRGKINEKQIAMRNEMVKENPDQGTVVDLQKELSELQVEFDQKAVIHRLEMRKLMPEKFMGRGYGRGAGRGQGCW